jgi:hypothetical protein
MTSLSITPGAAQMRNQTHVTALQLGEAPEGSRVTVVADSPLDGYEGFRRGNRFYVKIPLADFTSAVPHFRADGFEDVQVQRVGDNLIISFKLEPGAAALVDQRANRLDVIFSAPTVMARRNSQNSGPLPGNPELTGPAHVRTSPGRELDSNRQASPQTSPVRREMANSEPVNDRAQIYRPDDSRTRSDNAVAISSDTSPQSTPTPTINNNVDTSSDPAVNPSTLGNSTNWKTRMKASLQWVSANRLTTVIGALVLLNLILFLVLFLYRRRKNADVVKHATAPLA